jgi:hypothetical protein
MSFARVIKAAFSSCVRESRPKKEVATRGSAGSKLRAALERRFSQRTCWLCGDKFAERDTVEFHGEERVCKECEARMRITLAGRWGEGGKRDD